MELHLGEDQELEKLKDWWKRNGTAVIAGVALGAALVVGNKWWTSYRTERAEAASALYEQMMIRYAGEDSGAAQAAGATLMEDYAATPYAAMAAMFLARVSVEVGDLKSARAQLQWAIDNAAAPGIEHAARLRLARLMEQNGEYDTALELLAVEDSGGFAAQYHELRGDLRLQLGQPRRAQAAYAKALQALPAGLDNARSVLQMKIDDLGKPEKQQ